MTIQELRKLSGMSQSEFAKYTEVPISTLQHWEQGFRKPPTYIVRFIERILKADKLI